ncbi:hypothetical protein [Bacillus sp. es.034]|uniref:hypothetical protein n=1 Tax=Bacillus sp. es.034 TaxID=1761763 RepID=UPI000BF9A247|nr:hypothetical protein [Bacillus sp. es.034]PFG07773.1 hypothetical protein ATG71_4682 [Bacillus sp. es.034]
MRKREFYVIKDKDTTLYTIMGFNCKDGYGEVFIRDKNSTTYAFRGFNRLKTLKEAKKQIKSLT